MKSLGIILSENPQLYAPSSLAQALTAFNAEVQFANPFNGECHKITTPTLIFNRISGYRYDDYDLYFCLEKEKLGVPVINSPNQSFLIRDKLAQIPLMHDIPIPGIPSFSWRGPFTNKDYPLKSDSWVIKPQRSSGGRGIERLNPEEFVIWQKEALRRKDQRYIYQPFIPNKGEFRLFLINHPSRGHHWWLYKNNPNDWRHNLTQGATVEALPEKEVPSTLRPMHNFFRQYLAPGIYAIDFLNTHKGPVFLEINNCPGLRSIDESYHQSTAHYIVETFLLPILKQA